MNIEIFDRRWMTASKHVMNTLTHTYLSTMFKKIVGFNGEKKAPEFILPDFGVREQCVTVLPLV